MKKKDAPRYSLTVIAVAGLFFVALVPWVVEWLDYTPPMLGIRAFLNSLFLLVVVAVSLAFARREIRLRQEVEKRYRTFFDDAPLGTFTLGRDGRFSYANKKFREISGYSTGELAEMSWQEMVLTEDAHSVEERIARAYDGSVGTSPPFEVRALHREGTPLHLRLHYSVLERGGRAEDLLVTVQDLTRRRKLEAQLVKSERLAVAGQLAMGLAHEINNPLSIIKTSLRLLKDREVPGADLDDTLQDIAEEVDRIAEMVRVLMGFRDGRPGESGVTEVDDALQSLLHLMGPQIKKHDVQTRLSWESDRANAAIRPGQFRQIFFNLILNALDAMPGGGHLTLACRADAGTVSIRVEDTGNGILLKDQKRLYEPFFSTKSSNHHGLGLYVCYTILKSENGEIDVDSKVGQGTSFVVRLPRAE